MTNKGKYQTQNPIKRWLLDRFLHETAARVAGFGPSSVLDVGTGEGLFWKETMPDVGDVVGVDIRHEALVEAASVVLAVQGSATALPFADESFDLVVAIEILEHLDDPDGALREIRRVTRGSALVTVPWEPWFSLGVLVGSGQHLRRLGREPEHVNAFGRGDIEVLVAGHFPVVRVDTCAPWLIVEAVTKSR